MTDKELLTMLMDAVDYAYLKTDGTYQKELAYVVSDKMIFIKKQLDLRKRG